MEILQYKPQYSEFLMGEGERGHIDMATFLELVMQKGVGGTAESKTGSADWRNDVKNMTTVGEKFGFLIIPMGCQEAIHFEERYR